MKMTLKNGFSYQNSVSRNNENNEFSQHGERYIGLISVEMMRNFQKTVQMQTDARHWTEAPNYTLGDPRHIR